MARTLLAEWGIAHRLYDPMDVAGFKAMIGAHTRLAWLEAPGSITMEFPDLRALPARRARAACCARSTTPGAPASRCGRSTSARAPPSICRCMR